MLGCHLPTSTLCLVYYEELCGKFCILCKFKHFCHFCHLWSTITCWYIVTWSSSSLDFKLYDALTCTTCMIAMIDVNSQILCHDNLWCSPLSTRILHTHTHARTHTHTHACTHARTHACTHTHTHTHTHTDTHTHHHIIREGTDLLRQCLEHNFWHLFLTLFNNHPYMRVGTKINRYLCRDGCWIIWPHYRMHITVWHSLSVCFVSQCIHWLIPVSARFLFRNLFYTYGRNQMLNPAAHIHTG